MWIIFFLGLGAAVMAFLAFNVWVVMRDSDEPRPARRPLLRRRIGP